MRVAIVGSGVSGLSALWLLNEHSEHEVNIYEKGDYVGGHTHTVDFERQGKQSTPVDTGFIVCNPPTYPNFLRFLAHKNVKTLPTEMTFSVSRDRGVFEWAGEGLGGVFCQAGNLFNPRLYRMIYDVLRFNVFALDLLAEGSDEISIGDYLEREGYGKGFKEDYLLPMTAAIWSTPADKCALDFPAKTLVRFFHNHHLLQLTGKPKWLTVKAGARNYVNSVIEQLPQENLHLNTEIVAISSNDDGKGVTLVEASGAKHVYDHVILATHSDTTLKMLKKGGGVSDFEQKVLGASQWNSNEAVLHWDERFMPIRRRAYSAWNYLTSTTNPSGEPSSTGSDVNTVSLTYSMNILQHLPEEAHGPVLVTLNPPFPVDPAKTVGKWKYEHPIFDAESIHAQSLLPQIQNTRGISYAGAWTNYGFHEDGFSSGFKLATAEPFNCTAPYEFKPPHRSLDTSSVVYKTSKATLTALEHARRATVPVFDVASWLVVVGLVWVQQVLQVAQWKSGAQEVERIRGFWASDDGRKRQ